MVAAALAGAWLCALASGGEAHAQDARTDDVQAAAAAFAEGQRAQLRSDYAQAADLFELADRSAPNVAALRSAIRNHRAAGHLARAATLSRSAATRYPDDVDTRTLATEVLAEATPMLGSLRLRCTPACSLTVDGRAAADTARESHELFVDPGPRRLVASWPGREPAVRAIDAVAGAEVELELEASEVIAAPVADVAIADPVASVAAPIDDVIVRPAPPPGGISPAFFAVGAGLTVILLGVGIGSGIDTLSANDAYVLEPTRARYDDGVSRQWRTTGLFIGAGVLAAASLVVAIVTDWGGGSSSGESALVPWIDTDGRGAVFGLLGTFGGDS